jgi:hypothetical protein
MYTAKWLVFWATSSFLAMETEIAARRRKNCFLLLNCLTNVVSFAKIVTYLYLREKDHWGDPGVEGRVLLRRNFMMWDVRVRTGLSWLRIGTGGGRL